ncbi:amino acid ABC transporter substrate-binding protein [Aliibacillus thermotolerans]|uniref:Amino acid ABC transporter substrate-binding protein n=1 Tax=Aliibacillus thermotolerans TaxID=1834418 RepID=A0ABW0U310_9BACI|nr:amino acid ABC transporter substrate-binding protein [Aliibacillus thermotolerans]MDA3129550.1 transporter substrate-binding domain-containing protein [Aliibacillus thermotolerans]
MKIMRFLFVIAVSITWLAGCSKATTEDGKEIIQVAVSAEVNPPFLLADENNEPIGYDIDYLNEVEKRLPQYEFEYVWGEEESNLIGVGAGKFDFAMNWFFSNPEREERFLYPETPYGYSITGLIVHEDTDDIHSLDDMTERELAPVAASGGLRSILNEYNENNDPDIPLITVGSPSNENNLRRVESGRSDAAFLNITTFHAIQEHLHLDLKVGAVVSREPVYAVFHPDHHQLAEDINRVTEELIEDGTLPALAEKWFGVDFFQDLEDISPEDFG